MSSEKHRKWKLPSYLLHGLEFKTNVIKFRSTAVLYDFFCYIVQGSPQSAHFVIPGCLNLRVKMCTVDVLEI